MVIVLMALLLMHITYGPSFFGVKGLELHKCSCFRIHVHVPVFGQLLIELMFFLQMSSRHKIYVVLNIFYTWQTWE